MAKNTGMRRFIIILGSLVGGLVLAGVVILLPPVQKTIGLAFLRAQADTAEAEALTFFPRVQVTGLTIEREGAVITAGSLDGDISLLSLFGDHYRADALAFKSLVIDLSDYEGPPPTEQPEPPPEPRPGEVRPFPGILAFFETSKLTVGQLSGDCEIILPDEGGTLTANFTEGQFSPGKPGSLTFNATFIQPGPENGRAHTVDGTLSLAQHANGARLELDANATGGAALPATRLTATVERSGGTESYRLRLTQAGQQNPLVSVQGSLEPSSGRISGKLSAQLARADVQSFMNTSGLPPFSMSLSSECLFNTSETEVDFSGKLDGSISPNEGSGKVLSVRGDIDAGVARSTFNLDSLNLRVSAAGSSEPLLTARLAQAFTLNLTGDSPDIPRGELLVLAANGLDIALLNPFLPDTRLGGSLAGQGTLSNDGQHLRLAFARPLEVSGFSLTSGQQRQLADLTVVAPLEAAYNPQDGTLMVTSSNFNVSDASGRQLIRVDSILSLSGDTQLTEVTSQGSFSFIPLLEQPFAGGTGVSRKLQQPLDARFESAFQLENGAYRIQEARLSATGSDATDIADVELLQELRLTHGSTARSLVTATPDGTVARLRLTSFPLALIDSFWADGSLGNGTVDGSLILAKSGEQLELSASDSAPIRAEGLSLQMDGKSFTRDLSVKATFNARFHSDSGVTEVSSIGLTLFANKISFLNLDGQLSLLPNVDFPLKSLSLDGDADLAMLLQQPTLAPYNNTLRGNVTAALDATFQPDGSAEGDAKITLTDAQTRSTQEVVNNASLVVQASRGQDREIEADASIDLKASEQSSARLNFSFVPEREQPAVFSLTGDTLVVQDLQLLVALFQPPGPKARQPVQSAQAKASPSTPASEPFWGTLASQGTVTLDHLIIGNRRLNQIEAQVTTTNRELRADPVRLLIDGNPLESDSLLTFDPSTPAQQRYRFEASIEGRELPAASLLPPPPGGQPVLSGGLTFEGEARSTGPDPDGLIEQLQGNFSAQIKNGILRGLASRQDALSRLGGVLHLGSLLGGGRDSPELQAILAIVERLEAMQFDTMRMQIERAQNLDIELTELIVENEDLRLSGSGKIAYRPDRSLMQMPLDIPLTLSVGGELHQRLEAANLIDPLPGDAEYLQFETFEIEGSLANIKTTLVRVLLRTVTGGGLRGLLGDDFGRRDETDSTGNAADGQGDNSPQRQPSPEEEAARRIIEGIFGQ